MIIEEPANWLLQFVKEHSRKDAYINTSH